MNVEDYPQLSNLKDSKDPVEIRILEFATSEANEDERGLVEFALDHLEHFSCLPVEYEASDGKVWSPYKCWKLYSRSSLLSLFEKIDEDQRMLDD